MRTKKPTVQKNPVSSRSISKKVKEKTPLDKTKTVTDRDKRKYIDYKIKVKKGDTFYRISQEFELSLSQLYSYNDFGPQKDILVMLC